jgi:hypothetical protein
MNKNLMLQFLNFAGRRHQRCLKTGRLSARPAGSSTVRLHCLHACAKGLMSPRGPFEDFPVPEERIADRSEADAPAPLVGH